MLYLKIKVDKPETFKNKENNFFEKLLSLIIPKANPDFDDKIHKVSDWLLEFKNEKSTPNRELGLDVTGNIIVKMPYKKNYGYWTDNSLTYNDFKKNFNYKNIDKNIFEKYWSKEI